MNAIQVLQTRLNLVRDAASQIVVDGDCGPRTMDAIDALSGEDRALLEFNLMQETGMSIRETIVGERGYRVPDYTHLKVTDCDRLLQKACAMLKMDGSYAPIFSEFLRLEAASRKVKGVMCYNVLSRRSSARGLMQMQPAAWKDARAKALAVDDSLDIGSYADNVYFPANNLVAGLAYSLIGIEEMIDLGIPVNKETLYLCHNQGPYVWRSGKTTNVKGQSAEVRKLIAKYLA